MKLKILASAAWVSILCSACSGESHCAKGAIAQIAGEYAAAGQDDKALQVAQTIDNSFYKVNVLMALAKPTVGIARRNLKAGHQDRAIEILSQAIQVANTIEDADDKAILLEDVAAEYRKGGQKDKAAEVSVITLQPKLILCSRVVYKCGMLNIKFELKTSS